jgi:hypothetical protein
MLTVPRIVVMSITLLSISISPLWALDLNDRAFTDVQLQQLMQKSKKEKTRGIIYSWSPHMVLSFEGIKELKILANKYQLQTTFLLDSFAAKEDIERVLKNADHQITQQDCGRMESDQLRDMGIGIHYPTYLFYQNGRFILPRFPGYESAQKLEEFIKIKYQLK